MPDSENCSGSGSKQRQRIAFVSTGGHVTGLGHATRQLVVARHAVCQGHHAVVFTDASGVAALATASGIASEILVNIEDASILAAALQAHSVTHLVIDVPEPAFPALRSLAERWPTVLVVSRVGRDFEWFGSDVILIGESMSEWETLIDSTASSPHARVHSGRAYLTFRDEFAEGIGMAAGSRPESILVAHGGADPYGLTARCLGALEHTTRDYTVQILLGSANCDVDCIEGLASESKHNCQVTIDASDVAARMRGACLSLISGGNVRYESCMTGTPFVALSISQRQFDITEQVSGMGAGVNLGVAELISDLEIAVTVDDLVLDVERRSRMQGVMTGLFDMGGSDRILSIALDSAKTNSA